MEWGLATRRVIKSRCGRRHLFEVIDGESRNRGRNCRKLKMSRGNDMRTAAEAVLIESRTALLSRTRNCFSHYILRSGLRGLDRSHNRLSIWRAIVIAFAQTGNT